MAKLKVRKASEETTPAKAKKSGGQLYFVRLRGVRQAAVVEAHDKSHAKSVFQELFGILSTARAIDAEAVDADHDFDVDENGVVNPKTLT